MMKYLLILLLLFNSAKCQFISKNDIIICALSLVAGSATGTEETLKFHYNLGFAHVYPNACRQYWDPRVSWVNKDRSDITKIIPLFSDGYHLMRGTSRILTTLAIAISSSDFKDLSRKQITLKILKKFVFAMVSNRLGQYLTYDVIFRPRK